MSECGQGHALMQSQPASFELASLRKLTKRQVMSGAHSALEPRLPIPNRTVKRGSADDSVHSARESRSAPDSHRTRKPSSRGLFCFTSLLYRSSAMREDPTPCSLVAGSLERRWAPA